MHTTVGADTEAQLTQMERDAAQLHRCGLLDADGLSHQLAVVAGIRRVRASGRDDLADQLLRAWQAQGRIDAR
ncbi:MAG TPA: hypothetical protein VK891_15950 [Euzebyales bacterium]|nr:hypothetical protein [Euzebyales bacterium]